jgi:hypothetical protein
MAAGKEKSRIKNSHKKAFHCADVSMASRRKIKLKIDIIILVEEHKKGTTERFSAEKMLHRKIFYRKFRDL